MPMPTAADGALPSQLWPENAVGELAPESAGADSITPPPPVNGDNLLFFIPKGPGKTDAGKTASKKPAVPLKEVGADFVRACERAEADSYLIDPETVLHETQAEDLRRLLSYHAGESKISSYFLLLGQHETLPSSLDLAKIASGRLAHGNTCLVIYPLGEPWRIRFFMSRDITQAVTVKYLGEMMNACVQDSLQATDPVEQLQRFATHLSIRLIWLERAHPAAFAIQKDSVVAIPEGDPTEWYPEVTAEAAETAPPVGLWDQWKGRVVIASWVLAGGGFMVAFALSIVRWMRRRSRRAVWLIPEAEFTRRLGGAHCGGGGASARYN